MKDKDKYFNFPICLIDGIFEDKTKVLNNIFEYSVYAKAVSLEHGNIKDKINASFDYFGVTGNTSNGKALYEKIPTNSPKASIKIELYFDFYKNEKTEFEIAVLCGFCAIRSILLFKPYCKVTDNYMLVRMAGKATIKEIDTLPEPLKKYTKIIDDKITSNQYYLDKVKKELRYNWKLKMYGKHTRGFYVSFKMELTDLIFEVEKKRKKYIEKNYQSTEAEARKEALKRLYEPIVGTPSINKEVINMHLQTIIKKSDGAHSIETASKETIEALRYIIKKKLSPEFDLNFDTEMKNIIVKRK